MIIPSYVQSTKITTRNPGGWYFDYKNPVLCGVARSTSTSTPTTLSRLTERTFYNLDLDISDNFGQQSFFFWKFWSASFDDQSFFMNRVALGNLKLVCGGIRKSQNQRYVKIVSTQCRIFSIKDLSLDFPIDFQFLPFWSWNAASFRIQVGSSIADFVGRNPPRVANRHCTVILATVSFLVHLDPHLLIIFAVMLWLKSHLSSSYSRLSPLFTWHSAFIQNNSKR